MGLFHKSCIWVQRYEEHFMPPNKITNIFQLFFHRSAIEHSKAMWTAYVYSK